MRRTAMVAAGLAILASAVCRREERAGRLTSEPSGAAIWVDGLPIGETPREIALASHPAELEIRNEGHLTWRAGAADWEALRGEGGLLVILEPREEAPDRAEADGPLIVLHLREKLKREPHNVDVMGDLLHCLVLDGRFAECGPLITQALQILDADTRVDGARFWQELNRSLTGQYSTGQADSEKKVLAVVREAMVTVEPSTGSLSAENASGWASALLAVGLRERAERLTRVPRSR